MLAAAGNNQFSDTITITLSALDVTTYTVIVYAIDAAQQVSGEARGTLEYVRVFEPGAPPLIEELIIPDTTQRPPRGSPARSLSLIARVSDPDGLKDIERVDFWNVTTPLTRFMMCDDGNLRPCGSSQESGDITAGDALYTRRVFVSSTNDLGTNTFVFQAIDRAGLRSAELQHDIVIIE